MELFDFLFNFHTISQISEDEVNLCLQSVIIGMCVCF